MAQATTVIGSGGYERDIAAALISVIRPGWRAFDVGAHAGYYTLALSRLVGPTGHVTAFEPEPTNFSNLSRHLAINGIDNCTVIDAAVSASAGAGHLQGHSFGGHLADHGTPIELVALDTFDTPDFVKVDVEGAEKEVLLGAQRILGQRKTCWLIELHVWKDEECLRLLRESGCHIRMIDDWHVYASPI